MLEKPNNVKRVYVVKRIVTDIKEYQAESIMEALEYAKEDPYFVGGRFLNVKSSTKYEVLVDGKKVMEVEDDK